MKNVRDELWQQLTQVQAQEVAYDVWEEIWIAGTKLMTQSVRFTVEPFTVAIVSPIVNELARQAGPQL